MEEGIARGEKCVNIIDKNHRDERLSRLAGAGIDVDDQKRPGKSITHDCLSLRTREDHAHRQVRTGKSKIYEREQSRP
jgi:hypothetical protein